MTHAIGIRFTLPATVRARNLTVVEMDRAWRLALRSKEGVGGNIGKVIWLAARAVWRALPHGISEDDGTVAAPAGELARSPDLPPPLSPGSPWPNSRRPAELSHTVPFSRRRKRRNQHACDTYTNSFWRRI